MNIICEKSRATNFQFVWMTNTLDTHWFFDELDSLNSLSLVEMIRMTLIDFADLPFSLM